MLKYNPLDSYLVTLTLGALHSFKIRHTCLCLKSSGRSGRGEAEIGRSRGSTDPARRDFFADGSSRFRMPSASSFSLALRWIYSG